jgi:ElaB/YqjD/DUF883 family membrane-anchored ribosome-binding protein
MAKKCIDTKCKLWLEEISKQKNVFKKTVSQSIKNLENIKPRDEEKIKRFRAMLEKMDNSKEQTKYRKKELKNCARIYCNEGCKNTLFDNSLNTMKYNSKNRNFMMDERKLLFGKQKTILKNSFYNKLSAKTIKKLKKEGAISGCVRK